MPLLILLVMLAASIWLIPLVRSQRPIALPTLVLVMGVVFGPAFFAIDGPIQISLDRVLWGLMLFYMAVNLRLGNFELPKLTRTDIAIAVAACWFLVRCIPAVEVPDGPNPISRWLFYVAMPLGMYVAFRVVPIGQADVRWFSRVLLGLGVYLSLTAIFEVTGAHALVFPRHVVDPKIWEFFGRGRGPLLNPSGNGIMMTASLVLGAVQFFQTKGRSRVIFAVLVVIMLGGIYATLTRSAWMGAGAALGIVALVYVPRWLRVLGLATVVLLGGAMAMGLKDQLMQIKRDKHLTAADAEKSVQLRPLLAIVGWEMIKDRPLTGHGFGHYYEFSGPYHEHRGYDLPLEQARPYMQHNVVLSLAIDAGLIGISLLGGCVFVWLGLSWQLARSPSSEWHLQLAGLMMLGVVAAYFVNGMFQDVSVIPMVNMLLMMVAGMTVNLGRHLVPASASAVDRRRGPLETNFPVPRRHQAIG